MIMIGRTTHSMRRSIQVAIPWVFAVFLTGCSKEAKTERALKRGDAYFQKRQYEEAKIEYANVLKLDSTNSRAIQKIGAIWLEQGAPLRALPFLLRTSKDHPDDLEARTQLATAFLAMDARAEAAKTAASVLIDQPGNEEALLLLADAARLPGEVKQVRERVDQFPNKDSAAYHLALGSLLTKSGKIDKGREALVESARLDPNSPLPSLALAHLAVSEGKMDEAKKYYEAASKLASPRSLPAISLAEFLFQRGQLPEAGAALKPVLVAAPDYLPARRLSAQIAFSSGNKETAAKELQELLRQDHENLEGAILQAQIWTAEKNTEKSIDLLERLSQKLPKYPVIRFELARAVGTSGNHDRAIQILDELVHSNPDYAQAVLVLNELRYREGDARTAVSSLETFCKGRERYVPAELLLAQCYRAIGRQADALSIYQKVLEANAAQRELHLAIGMTYREMKKEAEAIRSFEEALKENSARISALSQLVEIDLERKDYAAAEKRLAEQGKEQLESAEILSLKAKVELAQDKLDAAEKTLLSASKVKPSLVGIYDSLIGIYIKTDRLKEAGAQAEALCAQQPKDVRAWTKLAIIRDRLGDVPAAIKAYEKVLELAPDTTEALNNLAYLRSEQPGQLDNAYALARRARMLNPEEPRFTDTLGWISFKRKEYPQALALLQESGAQLSDHAEAMFHLGMANYMMGRAKEATEALNKAASLPQTFAAKAGIPDRLALLNEPGRFDRDKLSEMGKRDPGDVYVWYRLGQRLRDLPDVAGAKSAFEKALQENSQMLPVMLELAALNAGPLKNRDAASELIRQASKVVAGDPMASAVVGDVAYQIGDWARAYSLLHDASGGLNAKGRANVKLAKAAYALGRQDEAKELLTITARDGDAENRAEAQRCLEMLKSSEDASYAGGGPIAAEVLRSNPDEPLALMAVGVVERAEGKLAEATARFVRLLQLLPDFALAQKQLAAIYVKDPAQLSKAHELASKARRALLSDSEIPAILAETTFHRKEFGSARQFLEERSRKAPLTSRELYMLGVCCFEQKSDATATDALKKALEAGVAEPMRSECERLLKLCEERKAVAG